MALQKQILAYVPMWDGLESWTPVEFKWVTGCFHLTLHKGIWVQTMISIPKGQNISLHHELTYLRSILRFSYEIPQQSPMSTPQAVATHTGLSAALQSILSWTNTFFDLGFYYS